MHQFQMIDNTPVSTDIPDLLKQKDEQGWDCFIIVC